MSRKAEVTQERFSI